MLGVVYRINCLNNYVTWRPKSHVKVKAYKAQIITEYVSAVSNKNTHLPVFEICVFRLYLQNHLRYKKRFFLLFASLSKKLSNEKRIFEVRSQNQLILSKTLFFQKKVSCWKKSAILKNSKTFFHGSKD